MSALSQDISSPQRSSGNDERLSTIFEVSKIIASGHDLEAMLSDLLDCLTETLHPADAGILWLFDPEKECLVVKAARGYDLEALQQMCLVPGESMTGLAFESGKARLYRCREETTAGMVSLSPENRRLFTQATVGVDQPLSAVCIPLVVNALTIGVLVLENLRQSARFSEEDIPFLQAVADLIALFIESARLREKLQETQALSEANRLKAELISILAHEMRTPLTSIKGYSTALLMEEACFSEETQREFLQIIDEECDTLQDLIRDLLESSIIDAGLLKLEPQPVLLPRLVESVVSDVAHRSKKHRTLVDFPDDFPIVDADPDRVTQVLRNLLDNAVKYSPQGGLVVIRGEVRSDEVVISVADQGLGISPEDLNRLFERFFRAQTGIGRHVVGSGLGLPISRTIVESHGGRIWAESQVGQGSTFYFTLPLGESAGKQHCPEDNH